MRSRCRIEGVGVDAVADRWGGDDLSGIGVEDGHHFLVATENRRRVFRSMARPEGDLQGARASGEFR